MGGPQRTDAASEEEEEGENGRRGGEMRAMAAEMNDARHSTGRKTQPKHENDTALLSHSSQGKLLLRAHPIEQHMKRNKNLLTIKTAHLIAT